MGARTRSQTRLISVKRSLASDLTSGLATGVDPKQTLVRQTRKNCVANSVRNLFPNLTLDDLFSEFDEDTTIGMLSQLFRKKYKSLLLKKAKGVSWVEISSYLTNTTMTGKFLLPIENKKHCIAIDCHRHIIIESDLNVPAPFALNFESFTKIKVVNGDLSNLYHVIQKLISLILVARVFICNAPIIVFW